LPHRSGSDFTVNAIIFLFFKQKSPEICEDFRALFMKIDV